MSTRPVIFLSAVSKELKTARKAAANALHTLGCESIWQEIFPTGGGDLLGMIRGKVDKASAVIQIVGQCRGDEPPRRTAEFGRVSYTQYEALYAHSKGKPVHYLFTADTFPTALHDPEPDDLRDLQRLYIERIQPANHQPIPDLAALENRVLRLRAPLTRLRGRTLQRAIGIAAALVLTAGTVTWIMLREEHQPQTVAPVTPVATVSAKTEPVVQPDTQLLAALGGLPSALADAKLSSRDSSSADPYADAFATLEKDLNLPPGHLKAQLPAFAKELLQTPGTPLLDRASALLVQKKFAEAEAAALQAMDETPGPDADSRALQALLTAAWAAWEQTHHKQALDHYRAAAILTDKARDPAEWARVQSMIAEVLNDQGQAPAAEAILRPVIVHQEHVLGPDDINTLSSRKRLAFALMTQGKFAEAETEARAIFAIQKRVLGAEHPLTLTSRHNLALALQAQEKNDEAWTEHSAVFAIRKRVLGPEHLQTIYSQGYLARLLYARGSYVEAETGQRAVLALQERDLGPEHPHTIDSRNFLAAALAAQKKHAEAEAEHRAVLAIRERVLGPEHPFTFGSRSNVAEALRAQENYAAAGTEYRAVLTIQEKVLGPEHPHTLASHFRLGLSLGKQGDQHFRQKDTAAALQLWAEGLTHAQAAQQAGARVLSAEDPQQQKYWKAVEDLQGRLNRHGAP